MPRILTLKVNNPPPLCDFQIGMYWAMLSIFYGRQAKIVPDKKKKLTFKHFFIFSSDILKSWEVFFNESVGFLLKYCQNLPKINQISR